MLTKAAPVQGGTPVAAPPGASQAVSAAALRPAPGVEGALSSPLQSVLRQITYPLTKPLDSVSNALLASGGTLTIKLANAALALGVEVVLVSQQVLSLAASTAAGSNGGGVRANSRFPYSIVPNVSFEINSQNKVLNASLWMLFQDSLYSVLAGVDPRQQKALAVSTTPVADTWPVATYSTTLTPSGGASQTFAPGDTYYNTTTEPQTVTLNSTIAVFLPFVNNMTDFLGLVPSAAQNTQLTVALTVAPPTGDALAPLSFISGADITGSSSVTSQTVTVLSEEYFLNSPPSGQEAAYALEAGTVVQRFEDSGIAIAGTGVNAAKYVAPQGANLLRLIANVLLGGLPATSSISGLQLTLSEFSDPWVFSDVRSYMAWHYRMYGRLPDPGIFVWDGTYTTEVPNSGDQLGWINAAVVINPTLAISLANGAPLGTNSNQMNVLRVQAVTTP